MRKSVIGLSAEEKKLNRHEWYLTIAVFLIEWGIGIWMGYNGTLLGDAMSRTANAFYVFYSEPNNLTSMGLVWNPLPSMMQLPFVLLSKLWRPIVTRGISMSFVSALFAAWGVKALYNAFHTFKVEEKYALLTIVLYAVNPYIIFYGANGMTELMMGAAGIQVICSLTKWLKNGEASNLLAMAFSFAVMFLIRYETVPFAICIALGMSLHILRSKREKIYYPDKKLEPLWYIESTMWVTFLPSIYAAIVWIIYNWMITGNPLYFMNSGYSMSAYSAYYTDYGGLTGILSFILKRSWPFLIPVVTVFTAKACSHKLKRHDSIIMLLAVLGLMVFTTIMIALGKSGGYVRYLCYPLMFSVGFIPYLFAETKKYRKQVGACVLLGLSLTAGCFLWGFSASDVFREDLTLNVPAYSEQLGNYINSHYAGRRVLMDSYRTYYAIMNTDHP